MALAQKQTQRTRKHIEVTETKIDSYSHLTIDKGTKDISWR
jgi:hypothetical protein